MTASTRVDASPRQVFRRMVELACLAPSVHNTQPWAWQLGDHSVGDHSVVLYADPDRRLTAEDPLGRNMMISCGAALHHFQLAARALGWRAEVERLPEPEDPSVLAHVRLEREPCRDAAGILEVMRNRCTDRRRFTSWPVPDGHLETLAEEARGWGASAVPVLDLAARFRLELAERRAVDLVGVRDPLATAEQGGGGGVARDSGTDVESSDALIVLGGEADDALSWLRTGEALSALWILATRNGLAVVPLSQPMEMPATRAELRKQLHGTLQAHLLVRIGWQAIGRSELPRTPRRPVEDVLRA